MLHRHVFVGLGTNLGDRLAHLQAALSRLRSHEAVALVTQSSIYETAPVGYADQQDFLNMVVEMSTTLSPTALLRTVQKIETEGGRVRDVRWGPRTIDIDILYWGEMIVSSKLLQIPHPEARKRSFVLYPMNEVAPEFKTPPDNLKITQLAKRCQDRSRVKLFC